MFTHNETASGGDIWAKWNGEWMGHTVTIRVYYEDTDMGGIVYYANYLKFIERGRSEFVRAAGVDQLALRDGRGIIFAVRRVEADFLLAARFDDMLDVRTSVRAVGGARIEMEQSILRQDVTIFQARVTLVCLDLQGKAVRIPADIRSRLNVNAP